MNQCKRAAIKVWQGQLLSLALCIGSQHKSIPFSECQYLIGLEIAMEFLDSLQPFLPSQLDYFPPTFCEFFHHDDDCSGSFQGTWACSYYAMLCKYLNTSIIPAFFVVLQTENYFQLHFRLKKITIVGLSELKSFMVILSNDCGSLLNLNKKKI